MNDSRKTIRENFLARSYFTAVDSEGGEANVGMGGSALAKNREQAYFPFMFAPMVGLSHSMMRTIVSYFMPAEIPHFIFAEMWNTRRIACEAIGSQYTHINPAGEAHLALQLLGNEEHFIQSSIEKIFRQLSPKAIDINMGCPSSKILKHNHGVALMGDIQYAAKVVKIARKACPSHVPVTVKLRIGSSYDYLFFKNFCQALHDEGANWLTIHPRLASQKRRGTLRFDFIKQLKAESRIPIVANGDIQNIDDVYEVLGASGADGLMLGRGAILRPWLFWQIAAHFYGQQVHDAILAGLQSKNFPLKSYPQNNFEENQVVLWLIQEFTRLSYEFGLPEHEVLRKFKFFLHWICHWFTFGQNLRGQIAKAESRDELNALMGRFFEKECSISARSWLLN